LLLGSEKLDATAGKGGKLEPKPPNALLAVGTTVAGAADGNANDELKEDPGAAELAPKENGAGVAAGATVAGGANENPDELATGAANGAPNTMGAGVMEKALDAGGTGAVVVEATGAGVDPKPPKDTAAGTGATTTALTTGTSSLMALTVLLEETALSLAPYLADNSEVYLM
jgi:hypothetical protein